MVNFDYYKSSVRESYLRKSTTTSAYLILVSAFIILLVTSVILFYISQIGFGEINLAASLILISCGLMLRYASQDNKNSSNLAEKLPSEFIELLERTLKRAQEENMAQITIELCFDNLSETSYGKTVFIRLGIIWPPQKNKKLNKNYPPFSPELVNLFNELVINKKMNLGDFLLASFDKSQPIQKYFGDLSINRSDLEKVVRWATDIEKAGNPLRFWENAKVLAGIGQDWSYGYTPILSVYSQDLSRFYNDINYNIDVFSHENKLKEIQAILVRGIKNNCLLVGEPGVGKKTLVSALALKMAQGDCMEKLKYKRIREIDVGRLLSGADSSELNRRLEVSFSEAVSAGNIILYIDNFQSLLEEPVNAEQVLLPFLQSSRLQIIASVTPQDFFNRIRAYPSISESFERIDINPPSEDETLSILLENINQAENTNSVFFPITTLKKITELSERYIHEIPQPEKSLRLLQEAAANFAAATVKIVKPEDIENLISRKVNVPIGEVKKKEKDKLLDLEKLLHLRVIGQDEAISAIANTLRRVRAGLTTGKRPAGVFLFLGPTGVGKTETAKTLAKTYFGSEKRMIRLDMSEYQIDDSINRLIGSNTNPSGILTDQILENPFSVILLDEIDKASKNVLNLFLQVFEDGRLTSPQGRVADFTNAIIIATSNAGSLFIQEKIKSFEMANLKEELINKLEKDNIFLPEFLNRFDGIIVFKPLTQNELTQIATLMVEDINQTLHEKKIRVEIEPSALTRIVQLGFNPEFGARPMRRVIQEKVENLLAKKMISGSVDNNQVVKIGLGDIG